ncbi:MAG: hypothetical protein Q9225_008081, partial [Loekoesia sp. 1 TL-2023]
MKEGEKKTKPAIFATGIAKYVCKRGRITVPPERILQASGLLPPKPGNRRYETPPVVTDSPAVPVEGDAIPTIRDVTSTAAEDLIDAALNLRPTGNEEWDWDRVDRERLRGMEIAEAWSRTERLEDGFLGEEREALGRYWDFP